MLAQYPRVVTTLITGGAGYIGAHVTRLLQSTGEDVVVVDDLSSGSTQRLADGTPLEQIDLAGPSAQDALAAVMSDYAVSAVIHFAARKKVAESVERPTWYYQQNVGGMAALLSAMERVKVDRLVFSSSAAVYGESTAGGLTEDASTRPANPYGETKLVCEWMGRAASAAWGLRFVALRYFNVAGAGWSDLADPGAANLIPLVLDSVRAGRPPTVFGADYPTSDGTCVRDYVHVMDLADAHLAALAHLDERAREHDIFNVGTGRGNSVLEVVAEVAQVVGHHVEPVFASRRAGDPAEVVAIPLRANAELNWAASRSLHEIVASAWGARASTTR